MVWAQVCETHTCSQGPKVGGAGGQEKVPCCFMQPMADPSFAFIRGGEAFSGCSSTVTSLPRWEQGKNYSPYKALDTTANDESTPLEVKLNAQGSP